MVTYVPVRKGFHRPLHLGTATGRGYRTACGKTLEGADVDVPRARVPRLTRRGLEDFYARVWQLERVCRSCEKSAP